jgi:hypothetical protein
VKKFDDIDISEIARECKNALKKLHLPRNVNLNEFAKHVEDGRGKPMLINYRDMGNSGTSGYWIDALDGDWIFVDDSISAEMQEHVFLHELGHIIFNHSGAACLNSSLAEHFPDLDFSEVQIRQVLQRGSNYTDKQENQAEVMAYLIKKFLRVGGLREKDNSIRQLEISLSHSSVPWK